MPESTQTPDGSAPPPPAGAPQPTSIASELRESPDSLTQLGVFASLFNLSFTSLVTTKLVRMLYLLAMIWIGLSAAFYIFFAFHLSPGVGLVVLFILAPISSLVLLGCTRILLELCIGLFQIMANSNELVEQGRRKASS
jgi:hypothetical protein